MSKYFTLFLLSLLVLTSCSSDDDEIIDVRILAAGEWTGTFSGDDIGTWSFTISENGSLTGALISTNVPGVPFLGTGMLTENGLLEASITVSSSTSTMSGTMNAATASGSWNNAVQGINGTWLGAKKE